MKIMTYEDIDLFLEKADPFLSKQEAINNLPLGLLYQAQKKQQKVPESKMPFMGLVEDDGEVCFAMVMTPPYNLIIYSEGDKNDVVIEKVIDFLIDKTIEIPGVIGLNQFADIFACKWEEKTGYSSIVAMKQRIFRLEGVSEIERSSGFMRQATMEDHDLVAKWTFEFSQITESPLSKEDSHEHAKRFLEEGSIFIWEDEKPVSMARRARATKSGIVVNLVYTPEEFRKKGYASSCVAELSQRLLDEGYAYCALYTDLANPTSNHIYQEIGYRPIGDSIVYHFSK